MAGLGDIAQLMSNLPALLSLMERGFFLAISLFLGVFAWGGWKRYKNWGLSIVATLLLGLGIQATAILLSQLIPFRLPYIPYALHALIMALVFYVILRLLSGDAQQIGKLVKGETFKKLQKEFNDLKEEFNRLVKLLERKKITPQPMSAKDLEKELGKVLDDKGIKEFTIKTRQVRQDSKIYHLKSKKNKYEIILDVYTGELISFNKFNQNFFQTLSKSFKKLASNQKVFTGLIMTLVIAVLMLFLVNPESASEISQSLDLSLNATTTSPEVEFTDYELQNTDCLSSSDLLYVLATGQFTDYVEQSEVPSSINITENVYQSASLNYNGTTYYLITTTNLSESEFNTALQNYVQQNLMNVMQANVNFCDIRYDYQSIADFMTVCSARDTLCECESLANLQEYCSIYSEQLSTMLSKQMGDMGDKLSGLGDLLGALG